MGVISGCGWLNDSATMNSLEKLRSAIRSSHKQLRTSKLRNDIDRSNVDICIPAIIDIYSSGEDNFKTLLHLLLMKGCREGSMDLVSTIVEYYMDVSELRRPFTFGDNAQDLFLENIILLRRHNVHVRKTSCFHMAAENGFIDILVYLIEKAMPIDADIVDCCGRTPLMVGLKHMHVVEYLIKIGADVNHVDQIGWTPLIYDIQKFPVKKCESFDLLLDAGADATIVDKNGLTAFHYSSSLSHPDYLKELINRGCYPSCNESGQLFYSSVPLCLCDINHSMLIEHCSSFPADVQLSLKYLAFASLGCTNILYCSSNDIVSLSQIVSSDEQVIHKIPFASSLSEIFGNVIEWTKEKDFKTGKDLLLQSFVILHRVAGFSSYNFLKALFNRDSQPYRFGSMLTDEEYMSVLVIASEIILDRLNTITLDWTCLEPLVFSLTMKKFESLCLAVDPSKVCEFLRNILEAVQIFYTQVNKLHTHRSLAAKNCYHVSIEVKQKLTLLHEAIIDTLHLVSSDPLSQFQGMQEIQRFILSSLPPLYLHDLSLSLLIYSIMDGSVAAELNTPSMIAKVLQGSLEWLNVPDKSGKYLLHYAIENHNFPLLNHLITNGAHPDPCASAHGSPLEYATSKGLGIFSSYIRNNTYPLSLRCHAALIVAKEIETYHIMDLPRHVKMFVSLHDRNRTMKELYLHI